MRRAAFGLAGVAILGATGTAFVALEFAPAQSHASRPQPAPAVAAPSPAPAGVQPADFVVAVTPVAPITQLVSPKSAVLALWDAPNGRTIGSLPLTTWGGPTTLPVVQTKGAWLQVRLGTRPNGSLAWVWRQDVNVASTAYRIVISVRQHNLTLYQNGAAIHTAPVGVGRPQWPTPIGPSFVAALVSVPARQRRVYGPLVIITATHSNVFTEFDGGDGTVGIHGYPSDPASTRGVASSHGCIRSSPQTMSALAQVPAGTPIDIVA